MNNRLNTAIRLLLLLLLTLQTAGVQADSCYKNFHVQMDAVPTGAGVVYLSYVIDETTDISAPFITLSTTPAEAIDENITVKAVRKYYCSLLANPAPGWELVGFTTELKDEYQPEDFLGTTSPTEVLLTDVDPLYVFDGQSYEEAQEKGFDHADDYQYYAVFRPVDEQGIHEVENHPKPCQPYRLNGVKATDNRGFVIVNGNKMVRKRE